MQYLNNKQIDYIFYHLAQHLDSDWFNFIRSKFLFSKDEEKLENDGIIFQLSPHELIFEDIIKIDGLPVLFPLDNKRKFYSLEGNSILFHHDILKSCFYLLSGYQEYNSEEKDGLGRFPYYKSIQYRLGMLHKPIVNYYFDIILKGIEEFCQKNNIQFQRKRLFNNWKVMLTHDIDKVETYQINSIIYKFKQIIGLSSSRYSKIHTLKLFFKYLYGYLTKSKNNPHWDFDKIKAIEKKHDYKSAFYFLPKDNHHNDSNYTFDEPKILKLFQNLDKDGFEIGLHGTVKSSVEYAAMSDILKKLSRHSPQKPFGIRQHRLLYRHPLTIKLQEKVGLKYDTTLGFAGHEGFRNSYCLPFKLYDFENEKMIDVWEIPLTVMDGTLFGYRNLSIQEAKKSLLQLIGEVKKFHGIFTFLWHNGFEIDNPNKEIPEFYSNAVKLFKDNGADYILGKDIVQKL